MSSYATRRTAIPALRHIGTWATWWWGVTCGYALMLVIFAYSHYTADGVSPAGWLRAARAAFADSGSLQLVLAGIAAGWVLGGVLWVQALRRHRIKLSDALTDLFLTIRK